MIKTAVFMFAGWYSMVAFALDPTTLLFCEDSQLIVSYNHPDIKADTFNEPPAVLFPYIEEDASMVEIKDGKIYYQGDTKPITTGPNQTVVLKNLTYWSGPEGVFSYTVDHKGQPKILPRFVFVKADDDIGFTVYHTDMINVDSGFSKATEEAKRQRQIEAYRNDIEKRTKNRHLKENEIWDRNNNNQAVRTKEMAKYDQDTANLKEELSQLQQQTIDNFSHYKYAASAGDIKIENGKIVEISNQTGHLRTSGLQFALVIKLLEDKGLLADNCKFRRLETAYRTVVADLGARVDSRDFRDAVYRKESYERDEYVKKSKLLEDAKDFLGHKANSTEHQRVYRKSLICYHRSSVRPNKSSDFDLSKAKITGYPKELLTEVQAKDAAERIVRLENLRKKLALFKRKQEIKQLVRHNDIQGTLDSIKAAEEFIEMDLLPLAIENSSLEIFTDLVKRDDSFLKSVLTKSEIRPMFYHPVAISSYLVGIAHHMLLKPHEQERLQPILSQLFTKARKYPDGPKNLKELIRRLMQDGKDVELINWVSQLDPSLRPLAVLTELIDEARHHIIVRYFERYVVDNQNSPFYALSNLKNQIGSPNTPTHEEDLKTMTIQYNTLAQEIISLLELMVRKTKPWSVDVDLQPVANADTYLGYLIILNGGELGTIGKGQATFTKYLGEIVKELKITNDCLLPANQTEITGIKMITKCDKKLSNYYLQLSTAKN